MSVTRFYPIVREFLGDMHRETRIALTPVPSNHRWVFLVGCYNSGTTLLAEMLGEHPEISALPDEGQFLSDELVCDYDVGVPRMWVEREDLFHLTEQDEGPNPERIKREWAIRLDTSKRLLLEKSPPNSARVRWLQANFEDPHFICIVREPCSVAAGIRRKAEPGHLVNGWPLEMAANQWVRSNELLLEDAASLRKVMWLRYEDLTADTDGQLARIAAFLGVKPFPAGLAQRDRQVHERAAPVRDFNAESRKYLSEEEARVLYLTHRGFVRGGAALTGADAERMRRSVSNNNRFACSSLWPSHIWV